jgi:cytochrome c-type biogenesis protein CcmH
MAAFYIMAAALALLTGLALAWPLLGGQRGTASREAREAALYRDQLAEIECDVSRGVLSPAEAESARAEVSRRLLAAARRAEAAAAPGAAPLRLSRALAAAALVAAPALGLAVYLAVGTPGRVGEMQVPADLRFSQAEAEALVPAEAPEPPAELTEFAGLIARLEKVMEQRPDDVQGLELLASGYVRLGRYGEGWRSYERLIERAGEAASAAQYAAMGEAMVLAAGGYVSPEAEAALAAALARDPGLPVARYYHALAAAQEGRIDEAIAAWERLEAETPADAPWAGFLERTLAEARALRDGAPGPGAAEMAAAEALSGEERAAMVEGMVARLEARLTSEGGSPEEWLRLMRAYVQLDRRTDAARIAALGIAAFEGSEAEFLREQALLLGLAPE